MHALSEVLLQHAEPCNIPLLTLAPKFPHLKQVGLLDIVGTGGDGKDSFNVSTASCFVLAACGALVAKHGNRSSSGSFGRYGSSPATRSFRPKFLCQITTRQITGRHITTRHIITRQITNLQIYSQQSAVAIVVAKTTVAKSRRAYRFLRF